MPIYFGNDTAVDPNAPEGGSSYQPKATPWGRELGVNQRPTGAKHKTEKGFCTYSASFLTRLSPRAMPWAMSGLAL